MSFILKCSTYPPALSMHAHACTRLPKFLAAQIFCNGGDESAGSHHDGPQSHNTWQEIQSNYSSRIALSPIFPLNLAQLKIQPFEFDPHTPKTLPIEPNVKWIGRPVAEISPSKFSTWEVGRSVGRSSYYILTPMSYTLLRYVRNVARDE